MIYLPFIGALAEGAIAILEKKVLRKRKVDFKHFTVFVFFTAMVLMIPLMFFFWDVKPEAYSFFNLIILGGIVILAVIANLCVFYAIKWEKLTEIEPVILFQPLFVILLALIFFPLERNFNIIIPAIIASLALIFSHVKKNKLCFNKYLLFALLGSLFYAFELILTRFILDYYSPITFYFFRVSFIFLITFLIFRPGNEIVDKKSQILIVFIGGLWIVYRVLLYYGYLSLGVVFTTLIFILGPIFVYLFARMFLKEKLTWRNIVATIIIILCIGYAIFVSS